MYGQGSGYIDIGTKATGDVLRKSLGLTPGSWIFNFTHAADYRQTWDLICGTSFGFSSIGIPGAPSGPDSKIAALSDWVDKKILSKSNMDELAKHGVDMDHPCVRVYTQEEVDANRKFLVASGQRSALRRFVRVRLYSHCRRNLSSHFLVQGLSVREGKMNLQTDGKRVVRPEAVQDLLKDRSLAMEKQRDDLKPQWVRDWEESRGQDRSVPP